MSERKRRGCGPIALLIALVVVLGVLVGVDRVAIGQVETYVARTLRTQLQLAEEPAVTIHGFPFLTQVARNRFDRVDLSGRDVPAGTPEQPLLVEQMDLQLGDVRTADRFQRITAGDLSGSAYITWAEVADQAGVPLRPEEGDRVRVDVTANLYGQHVPFVVSARPVLDVASQQVRLSEPQLLVASYRVPDAVVQRIADETVPPIELSLPMGLSASDLRVGQEYLELDLSGTDVRLVG
ncbi:MAG: DUF2993 domain-containing protein [Propionibacteriaceae bacterium]|nr:DUF2993 domain-containing protein [Propionibacteriaceae bacterium]